MSKLVVILAAACVAAVVATSASAHPGSWYWSRVATENYILDRTNTSDDEAITEVSCTGMGRPLRSRGRVLWHHLRCEENDDLDREFTVIAHPTSRYHAALIEIACDDSFSEYACPE